MDSEGTFSPGASLPSALQANTCRSGKIRFPDFYCIGAQKAGTTWLFDRLSWNPKVWIPVIKEVDHFSEMYMPKTNEWAREQRRTKYIDCGSPEYVGNVLNGLGKDDTAYGMLFAAAPPASLTGDFSPEYMLLPPAAIAHVRRLSPHARIVLMVRDPVDRLWSHVKHVAQTPENISIDLLNGMLDQPYVLARADYAGVLQRWRRVFSADQVFVGNYERIRSEPEALLRDFHEFLQVDGTEYCLEGLERVVHPTFRMEIPDDIYRTAVDAMAIYMYSFARHMPEIGEAWLDRHGL